MPFPADEIDEDGFYWMKRPDKPSTVVICKGQATAVAYGVSELIWYYIAPGMMGYDTVSSLDPKTKFDGPIRKPKWTKE
jgi:hypothetical protein